MNDAHSANESFVSKLGGWLLISGIVLTFVGGSLFLIFQGGIGILEGRKTYKWAQTPGVILRSDAVHQHKPGDDAHYWWDFKYEYTVEEKTLQGDRYAIHHRSGRGRKFSLKSSNYDLAEGKYHAGDPVTVYFDPEDPQSAVLKQGPTFFTIIEFVIGITLTSLVAIIVFRSVIQK